MRRHPIRKQAASASLFPFLAVLMCTMGALIILLVMMVHQARVQAEATVEHQTDAATPSPTAGVEASDLDEQRERLGRLRRLRDEAVRRLAEHQDRLGHLESHMRQVREELAMLSYQSKELEGQSESRRRDRAAEEAELTRLNHFIDSAEKALAEAKKKAADHRRSFAIIPYKGPNGTPRRPIYVECLRDEVVIQPEQIVLRPGDFREPMESGGPLAAALRATREYWSRLDPARRDGEPYPLLIVRPQGIEMYGSARSALRAWDAEFGYELVSAEMKIEYPTADPALAEVQRTAVENARRRRRRLALIQPRRPGRLAGPYLRATPGDGGFVLEGASGETGPGGFAGPDRDGFGGSGRGGFRRRGNGADGQDTGGIAGRPGEAPLDSGKRKAESGGRGGTAGRPGEAPHGAGREGGESAGTGQAGLSPQGDGSGGSSQAGSGRADGASSKDASQPAEEDEQDAGRENADGGRPSDRAAANLSTTRGKNWALPNAAVGSTAIVRPIRVACSGDRLVILPDKGTDDEPKEVRLRGGARETVDAFVSVLWKHMDGWGTAGPRAYWKPLLRVEVTPAGRRNFAELEALLEGSGIKIEQVTP